MLCPFCGFYSNNDDAVCPDCGKLLPRGENRDTGVMAIRQGKKAREEAASDKPPIWMERQGTGRTYIDPEVRPAADGQVPVYASPEVFEADGTPLNSRPIERREDYVYGEQSFGELQGMTHAHRNRRRAAIGRRGINWSLALVIMAGLALAGLVAGLLWLRSDSGQRFIVRRDGFLFWDVEDADTEAIWYVAQEQALTGDFDTAIRNYETARRLNEENGETDINGLMNLAEAYVAVGRTAEAEEIYVHLYTDVVPSRIDPYVSEIRIMIADGREAEAAELMKTAYQKTGDISFSRDRASLLPSLPTADLIAGLFTYRITLHLTSLEDYPIYYVINNAEAVLPEEGERYDAEKGLRLDEGSWQIRAVCVNGDLISDEWSGIYRVDLPRPFQPRANLAPNTYSKTQYVKLFPSKQETDPNVVIYYTIDGSIPDSDSPLYEEGSSIRLPNGTSTLHAVAVNRNGKQGNMLTITYKIDKKPYPPMAYVSNDPKDVGSVKLNSTTYEAFVQEFGEETSREDVSLDFFKDCLRCHYSWGYVTYQRVAGTRYLIEVSYNTSAIKAPRGTAVGMSLNEVVGKFRDMGQVESASGNRGLYSNEDGTGKIYYNQDDGTRVIRYIAYTADGHRWRLDYNVSAGGTVTSIYQLYVP